MARSRRVKTAVITLPSALDARAAPDLLSALLAGRGARLTLDASEVTQLGGQCLQVLAAARCCWDADGQVLDIANPSARLQEAMHAAGAAALLAGACT